MAHAHREPWQKLSVSTLLCLLCLSLGTSLVETNERVESHRNGKSNSAYQQSQRIQQQPNYKIRGQKESFTERMERQKAYQAPPANYLLSSKKSAEKEKKCEEIADHYVDGRELLLKSVEKSLWTVANFLLQEHISPNSLMDNGYTLLMELIKREVPRKDLEVFIRKGCDVTAYSVKYGMQALHRAAELNNEYAVHYLLSLEEQVHVDDVDVKGNTALHYAARYRHLLLLKNLIVYHRADVNKKNEEGQTPLVMLAATAPTITIDDNYDPLSDLTVQCAGVLVDAGADLYNVDGNGNTVYHHVAASGHLPLAQYLTRNLILEEEQQGGQKRSGERLQTMRNHMGLTPSSVSLAGENVEMTFYFEALSSIWKSGKAMEFWTSADLGNAILLYGKPPPTLTARLGIALKIINTKIDGSMLALLVDGVSRMTSSPPAEIDRTTESHLRVLLGKGWREEERKECVKAMMDLIKEYEKYFVSLPTDRSFEKKLHDSTSQDACDEEMATLFGSVDDDDGDSNNDGEEEERWGETIVVEKEDIERGHLIATMTLLETDWLTLLPSLLGYPTTATTTITSTPTTTITSTPTTTTTTTISSTPTTTAAAAPTTTSATTSAASASSSVKYLDTDLRAIDHRNTLPISQYLNWRHDVEIITEEYNQIPASVRHYLANLEREKEKEKGMKKEEIMRKKREEKEMYRMMDEFLK